MTRLELTIRKWTPVRAALSFSKRMRFPGADGMTWYDVLRFFVRQLGNAKLNERSAAVTYNFLMAIPPTLLFLFSLIPYLPLGDVHQIISDTINLVAPNENIRQSLRQIIIEEFLTRERGDILSFGVLLTIFFSSNGMMGLMRSFDRSVPVYVKRTQLQRRLTALKLTLMLICVAIISLGVLIIQTNALNDIIILVFNSLVAVKLFSFLIIISIVFCSISIIYTYGPSLTNRFEFVSAGSVFATIFSVIATTVFFFLVDNFINYNKVYGPIGTLIAFMVWMWLNTLVILLGYELNVSILLGRSSHAEKTAPEVNS